MTPKEARQLWVDALRSGEYRQAKGHLHLIRRDPLKIEPEHSYCCLGVACMVAIDNGVQLEVETPSIGSGNWHSVRYDDTDSALPSAVQEWLGLQDSGGGLIATVFGDNGTSGASLWQCNDRLEMGFDQIADIIDEGKVRLAA